MTRTYHMAIDLGASSGRLMLGWLDDGVLRTEEVHRFGNEATERDGTLAWDVEYLFGEILAGLRKAGESGRRPASLGVDTWGVDFVLLDEDGERLGQAVAYRDGRTAGMDEAVSAVIPPGKLYARTGVQPLIFNTIYQLASVKARRPDLLDRAAALLMLPQYFNYLLTGVAMNEYTIATTSQLVGAESGDWDWSLIDALGFPKRIFGPLSFPGAKVGCLKQEVRERIGYDCEVLLPPSHDTASAVLARPDPDGDSVYLSSGTWSLMGIELDRPDCRDACRRRGFTNEGGYNRRYRFLKNIVGLWIVQSLRKELAPDGGFAELTAMAGRGMHFDAVVDVNHSSLLAPKSMARALRDCCREQCGIAPATDAELVACAYKSLAKSYAATVDDIERLSGKSCDRINIMGGGCRDGLLNSLTAGYTGREVFVGPVEATAVGNLLSQMLDSGELSGIAEARRTVRDSFAISRVERNSPGAAAF